MYVWFVSLHEMDRDGRRSFMNFECEYPTIEALNAAFKEHPFIHGYKLWTTKTPERGVLSVTDSVEFLLHKDAVYSITVPSVRFLKGL